MVLVFSHMLLGLISFIAIKTGLDVEINHQDSRAGIYIKRLFDGAKIYNHSKAWEAVNGMESDWECCGTHNSSYWDSLGEKLPSSCCSFEEEEGEMSPCRRTDAYTDGCTEVFRSELRATMLIIGGVALSFVIVEVSGAKFHSMNHI